jgi:hypothetical protein
MDDESEAETIGVLKRDGRCRYVKWLGFIDTETARNLGGSKPVKLEVARIGVKAGLGNEWRDLDEGEYVMGCLTEEGVYAVADVSLRTVKLRDQE